MSDVSQGPGWWLASDGKWYSPEQSPGLLSQGSVTQASYIPADAGPPTLPASGPVEPWASPEYGPPPTIPGHGPSMVAPGTTVAPGNGPPPTSGYGPSSGGPPYGAPPTAGYGYGYPSTYPPYAYAGAPRTNGLAVASLVCSFFFWLYGLGAVLAIVFGFIARSQIKHSGGMQRGKGLALAGIIIGFASLVIAAVLITVLVVVVQHHCRNTGNCTFHSTYSVTN